MVITVNTGTAVVSYPMGTSGIKRPKLENGDSPLSKAVGTCGDRPTAALSHTTSWNVA
jgi:hypothetical protein